MLAAVHRARTAILSVAETFEVSSTERKGVFTIATPEIAAKYADQVAVDSSDRPIRLVIVPGDDTTDVSDTIDYAGLSLSILSIVERRFRGAVLFKIIVAH
jgi:hypothetical protein